MIRTALLTTLSLCLATSAVSAQVVNARATPREHTVGLEAGFEHGALAELGYARALDLPYRMTFVARLEMPTMPAPLDGGVQLGVAASHVGAHGFGVSPRLLGTVRWVDGSLVDARQVGVIAGAAAGYFQRRWFAAFDLEWDKSLVTNVVGPEMDHSGWYGSGGGTLRGGLAASVSVTQHVDLGVRGGIALSEELNLVPGLPFYAALGVAARF